jgi:hypothetical protein
MAITSRTFDEALDVELERLIAERIAEYEQTDEFWERVDANVQKSMEKLDWMYHFRGETEPLCLSVFTKNYEVDGVSVDIQADGIRINLEEALAKEIKEDPEGIPIIRARLEAMLETLKT